MSPRVLATVRAVATVLAATPAPIGAAEQLPPVHVVVPKLWDAKKLADWATPVAGLGVAPSFVSEQDYYAAPVDNLRTYPLYHPSREPPGYRESLLRRGAQPLIEPEKLKTGADWIEAGRRVFEELDSIESRSDEPEILAHFTSADSIDKYRKGAFDAMTANGVIPGYRWVVDRDRKLKVCLSSCSDCHSRLMPDGTLLYGAPSNFEFSYAPAVDRILEKLRLSAKLTRGEQAYASFGVPWLNDDTHRRFKTMSDADFTQFDALENGAPPAATFARFNGSPFYTTRMADLRGIRERRYLDATATHRNRGPEDVARYGILVEYADAAVFGPHRLLPPEINKVRHRPPDEAMYALALFLYSLDQPKSPHPFDEQAKRGQSIFEAEGCTECHSPPLYTNNKLVAAPGFDPPLHDPATQRLDISKRRVGTDPGLALRTRKGTGYYKIPTLRGLWYRGLYEHSGSVATLEDWFDSNRLRDDYEPTGWKGPGLRKRAVPGHKFGLDLSAEDKHALIAFLRTL